MSTMKILAAGIFVFIFTILMQSEITTFEQNILSQSRVGAQKVLVTDLDQDGDMDILSGSKNLIWWENKSNKQFTEHLIVQAAGEVIGMSVIDLDQDGDMDILSASYGLNSIIWWKNDGALNFKKIVVDEQFDGAHDVTAADFNGDNLLDILAARGDKGGKGEVAIWINGKQKGFKKQIIYSGDFCHSVAAGDLNKDGKTDIAATQFKEGVRVFKNSGNLLFKEYFLPLNGAHEVKIKDVNGDQKPDVLCAGYMSNSIVWWENQGKFQFFKHIVTDKLLGAVTVDAGDIDSDGDIDFVGGSDGANDIRWWENLGSNKFKEYPVAGFLFKASGVGLGDLDKDGDLDVVGSAWKGSGEITWWENMSGILKNERNNTLSGREFIKYLRVNGIDAAGKLYQKIKAENPSAKIFTKIQFTYLGYEFLRLKQYDKAVKTFQLQLQEFPDYANGYDSLGEAYMTSGNKKLAIKNYQKSLELNPQNKNAAQKLRVLNRTEGQGYANFKDLSADAIGMWREGKRENAVKLYKKALKLFPDNTFKITQNLVFMFMQLEQPDKAFEMYEYGHSKGLYYAFYIKSGPTAKLMKYDRFKKIYQKNQKIIKEMEKKSKPEWKIKIPENYDKSKRYPLLVVLHGWSGSLKRIVPIWKSEEYKNNLIIVYLQSSQISGIGAYNWNDIEKSQKDVNKLLEYVKTKYPIDEKKIILAGFSQGAATVIRLVVDGRIKSQEFIAHCPGGELVTDMNQDSLIKAAQKGVMGMVISTEKDHNKALQKKMIDRFKKANIKHEYMEIKGIGHWYPKDFSRYLDRAIGVLFKNN